MHNDFLGVIGYGTHNQPQGTWSDDSALSFCLAESLVTTNTTVVVCMLSEITI